MVDVFTREYLALEVDMAFNQSTRPTRVLDDVIGQRWLAAVTTARS